MFFSKALMRQPQQQLPMAQQQPAPQQRSMMFAPQQQPQPQVPQAPVDMQNIYGGMRGQFDPDALRRALIAQYAPQLPGIWKGGTPIRGTPTTSQNIATNYTGQVLSGMNDFAQRIRAVGGFKGGS